MFYLFSDENFYLALSFLALSAFGYFKLKSKFVQFLNKRINGISKSINNAACEKDQALLEFTRINNVVSKLPDDIVKIWNEYNVDLSRLHKDLEAELNRVEKMNNVKLENIQRMVWQAEYSSFVKKVADQFKFDVLAASTKQKELILQQSIGLLSTVSPSDVSRRGQ
ncbi:MAG: ATPase B chain family protein [Holosporales bacterium]|nr:ATPase B chain family protein [Holosporales bacterium]